MRRATLPLAILLGLLLATAGARGQDIQVVLNGEVLSFDQPPAMIGGRLMVPLRGIFEALSADVLYDAATRTIKATKASTVVELTLGSREARINGRPVYLDVSAGTLGGRTMVPLRFVSESLGAEVKWQGATRTVMISAEAGEEGPQPSPSPPPAAGRPQIDQVIHNATGTLKPGDPLEVIMTGDPDGEASFEIVGVTDTIPMRHAGRGRYEGRYVIPQGADVERGVVVGHLVRGGLETIKEASRPITIEARAAAVELSPGPGEVVGLVRPTVEVRFPAGIQPSTARLFVDGRDVTQQAQWTQGGLAWAPGFDMAAGKHSVRVVGRDLRGAQVDRRWDFTVNPTAAAGPVQQLYPQSGSTSSSSRPTIGARLDPSYRLARANLVVDGQDRSTEARLQGLDLVWTPPYDLPAGTHTVRLDMVDAYGQPDQVEWSFVVTGQAIRAIQVEPSTVHLGEAVRVTATGQPGGRAWMTIGGGAPIQMSEVSSGTYVGTYVAGAGDQGQQPVEVSLQIANQRYQRFADVQVRFAGQEEGIQTLSVSPTGPLVPGQTVVFTVVGTPAREVRLNAFAAENLRLQETSPGVYGVTVAVPVNFQGNAAVSARMRRQDGAWVSRTLTVQVSAGNIPPASGLALHNLSEGMALPPVFNVQGTATPGTPVTVRVDFQKPAMGGLFLENRTFDVRGAADARGHFDIQVDASRVPAGQAMQLTVSAGGEQRSLRLSRR